MLTLFSCRSMRLLVVLPMALTALSGCGWGASKAADQSEEGRTASEDGQEDEEDDTIEAADEGVSDYPEGEKGGETYPAYGDRRDSYRGAYGSYAGDGCTEDCSGHEAGYAWAQDKGIDDPEDCGGRSWSFVEGCRAFAGGEDEEESEEE